MAKLLATTTIPNPYKYMHSKNAPATIKVYEVATTHPNIFCRLDDADDGNGGILNPQDIEDISFCIKVPNELEIICNKVLDKYPRTKFYIDEIVRKQSDLDYITNIDKLEGVAERYNNLETKVFMHGVFGYEEVGSIRLSCKYVNEKERDESGNIVCDENGAQKWHKRIYETTYDIRSRLARGLRFDGKRTSKLDRAITNARKYLKIKDMKEVSGGFVTNFSRMLEQMVQDCKQKANLNSFGSLGMADKVFVTLALTEPDIFRSLYSGTIDVEDMITSIENYKFTNDILNNFRNNKGWIIRDYKSDYLVNTLATKTTEVKTQDELSELIKAKLGYLRLQADEKVCLDGIGAKTVADEMDVFYITEEELDA